MKRTLRILLAGDTSSPHVARLAAALYERRFKVMVLDGAGLVEQVNTECGADVTSLPYSEMRLPAGRHSRAVTAIEARLNHHRLQRLLKHHRVDAVHLHNLYFGRGMGRWAWPGDLPAPIVLTAWGTDVDDSAVPKHLSYPPLRQALLSRATLITGDSEAMLRRCRSFVPHRPPEDFRLVRWYADLARFNPSVARAGRSIWRKQLGIGKDDFVFLSHRNTRPNYQIDRILRSFARILKANDVASARPQRQSVLVIKGMRSSDAEQNRYLDELQRAAAPLGDRVRFVGEIPTRDVPAFFGIADVAIGIPKADGAPASIPELLALGVPLIVSELEDYQGLVQPGRNVLLVDASHDEPVAEAMSALAQDDALHARMRAAASDVARSRKNLAVTVDGFVDCYIATIAARR